MTDTHRSLKKERDESVIPIRRQAWHLAFTRPWCPHACDIVVDVAPINVTVKIMTRHWRQSQQQTQPDLWEKVLEPSSSPYNTSFKGFPYRNTRLQTFWLALHAQVQHLSWLASRTPSLWPCQCRNSTSACWDAWPVVWQRRGGVEVKQMNLKKKRNIESGSSTLSLHEKNVERLTRVILFSKQWWTCYLIDRGILMAWSVCAYHDMRAVNLQQNWRTYYAARCIAHCSTVAVVVCLQWTNRCHSQTQKEKNRTLSEQTQSPVYKICRTEEVRHHFTIIMTNRGLLMLWPF